MEGSGMSSQGVCPSLRNSTQTMTVTSTCLSKQSAHFSSNDYLQQCMCLLVCHVYTCMCMGVHTGKTKIPLSFTISPSYFLRQGRLLIWNLPIQQNQLSVSPSHPHLCLHSTGIAATVPPLPVFYVDAGGFGLRSHVFMASTGITEPLSNCCDKVNKIAFIVFTQRSVLCLCTRVSPCAVLCLNLIPRC